MLIAYFLKLGCYLYVIFNAKCVNTNMVLDLDERYYGPASAEDILAGLSV